MMNTDQSPLKRAHIRKEKQYEIDVLELPFHGNMATWLINPCRSDKYKLEANIDVQKCVSNLHAFMQMVSIPKLRYKGKSDLMQDLKNTTLMSAIKDANFSSMFANTSEAIRAPKFISEVDFTLDEKGAEGAAATCTPMYLDGIAEFKLCSPFGIAIVDYTTCTILGLGQILNFKESTISQ